MIRTIDELLKINTFIGRYEYLKLTGSVGASTFGFDRYLNQVLYSSLVWKRIRDIVMIRDNGCDLAMPDYPVLSTIVIHHMNPISVKDFESRSPDILDPIYLVTVSVRTHQAIHYSNKSLLTQPFKDRFYGDTKLW